MVQYQNLTRKPELYRGPGTMFPLNPPLAGPASMQFHTRFRSRAFTETYIRIVITENMWKRLAANLLSTD